MDPSTPTANYGQPLDLSAVPKRKRLPRHKRGEKFLWGPVPWSWIEASMRLPVRASDVGVLLWHLAGLKKSRTVRFSHKPARAVGLDRRAVRRGLDHLERAGLISVERKPGRAPLVTILDAPATASTTELSDGVET